MEHGKISIELDEITPCLRRISDGAVVQTKSYRLKSLPKGEDFSDWEFDWKELFAEGFEIYSIKAEGDPRTQGLIALEDRPDASAIFIQDVESAPWNSKHNPKYAKKEYAGVGAHLFALACLVSAKKGYSGYVSMVAKTNLVRYYHEKLGARQIGRSSYMFIDEVSARKLLVMYYGKNRT
jgi:hypothetical protein